MRCAVTGTLIHSDALIMRVNVPAQPRKPKYLEPGGDIVVAPQTLHQHPLHGGTVAIGLAWSGGASQYFGAIDHQTDERRKRESYDWWLTAYGQRLVLNGMAGKVGVDAARYILRVLLTMYREGAHSWDIADRFGETHDWMRKKIRWAEQLAR